VTATIIWPLPMSAATCYLARMAQNQEHPGERIAKTIARAGLCSRRDAEGWISAGRVAVNGKVLDSPAFNVQPGDRITVDGEPLVQRERTRLFFFHKPRGTVTTAHDPEGRTTVFDILPEGLPRVVTVGRLDINTEGLLLLTNDGGLARALELPSTGWLRRYRVRAHGHTDQAKLDELSAGVTIDGVHYRGIEARLDREQGANTWLTIGLREGKNREVKKVLEHIGLDVNRLIRVSFGPFQLGDLEEGAVDEVKTRILKDQLGDKIAELANADFEAPLHGERDERPARREREDGPVRRAERPARRTRSEQEPAEPPRESPKPGKRRHVSASREMARARNSSGDRKRIERAETADRRGRAVPVERVIPVRKPRPASSGDEPVRRSARNARNFAALERDTAGAGAAPRAANPRDRRDARPEGRSSDGKFRRAERDFTKPDRRAASFEDIAVPERTPWGAPQGSDEQGGAGGKRELRDRGERKFSGRSAAGKTFRDRKDGPRSNGGSRGEDRPRGTGGGAAKFRSNASRFDRPDGETPAYRKRPDRRDDDKRGARGGEGERPRGAKPQSGRGASGRDWGAPGGGNRERIGGPGAGRNGSGASRPPRAGNSHGKPPSKSQGKSQGKPFGRPPGKTSGKRPPSRKHD
jgi:23S rRNA pseudouridine2605 synthase